MAIRNNGQVIYDDATGEVTAYWMGDSWLALQRGFTIADFPNIKFAQHLGASGKAEAGKTGAAGSTWLDNPSGKFARHIATGEVSDNIINLDTPQGQLQNAVDWLTTNRRGGGGVASYAEKTTAAHLIMSAAQPTPAHTLSEADKQTLAYTLLGEAEGDGAEGMIAVANTIKNRTQSGQYSSNPVVVALQPNQYSTWNDGGEGGNQPAVQRRNPVGSKNYNIALGIVNHVFEIGDLPDITGGAIMYHESSITPYWADSSTTAYGTIEIGHQTFYPTHPVPPMNIPSVASLLDVTPIDVNPTPGMVVRGNLPLTGRPQVMTPEGEWATVRTIGIQEDGLEVLIPTVSHDGRLLTDDQAIDYYHQTGEHLGKFWSPWLADAYAQQVHEDQAKNLIELPRPRPVASAPVEAALKQFGGDSDPGVMSVTSTLGWDRDAPDRASSIFRSYPLGPEPIETAARSAAFGVDERAYQLLAPNDGTFNGIGEGATYGQMLRDFKVPLDAPPPLIPPPLPPKVVKVRVDANGREVHAAQPVPETPSSSVRAVSIRPDGTVIGQSHRDSQTRLTNPATDIEVEVPVRITPEGIPVYERPTIKIDATTGQPVFDGSGNPVYTTPGSWVTTARTVAASKGRLLASGDVGHPTSAGGPYLASLSPGKGIVGYGVTDPSSIFYSPPEVRNKPATVIPPEALKADKLVVLPKPHSGPIVTVKPNPSEIAVPGGGQLPDSLPPGVVPKSVQLNDTRAEAISEARWGKTLQLPAPTKPKAPSPMPTTSTILVRQPNPDYTTWLKTYGTGGANAALQDIHDKRETQIDAVSRGSMGSFGGIAGGVAGNVVPKPAPATPPPPPRTILVPKKVPVEPPPPTTPQGRPVPQVTPQGQPPRGNAGPTAAQVVPTPQYVDRLGRPLVQVQTTRYNPDTNRFEPYTRYEPVGPAAPATPAQQAAVARDQAERQQGIADTLRRLGLAGNSGYW